MASAADPSKRECQCSEGYGAKDCSLVSTALEFGKTVSQEPVAFERTLFQLPAPTGEQTGDVIVPSGQSWGMGLVGSCWAHKWLFCVAGSMHPGQKLHGC